MEGDQARIDIRATNHSYMRGALSLAIKASAICWVITFKRDLPTQMRERWVMKSTRLPQNMKEEKRGGIWARKKQKVENEPGDK